MFGYPHTSCGCFEGVAFYLPEVDGFGLVHRGYREKAVNGLSFSTLADSTAGGRQIDGFHGISIEYMRSPMFLKADGGWSRIVWIPAEIKERVGEFIPREIVEKIATEKDAKNIIELKSFLKAHGHPVTKGWRDSEVSVVTESEEKNVISVAPISETQKVLVAGDGFKIILKNAKIHVRRVVIRTKKERD